MVRLWLDVGFNKEPHVSDKYIAGGIKAISNGMTMQLYPAMMRKKDDLFTLLERLEVFFIFHELMIGEFKMFDEIFDKDNRITKESMNNSTKKLRLFFEAIESRDKNGEERNALLEK